MISADDQQPDGEGMAGRLLLVPIARLDAILDSIGRAADARRREYAPLPRPAPAMSSAPFRWRDDGRIITVVAKTHHYWSAHIAAAGD